MLEFRDVPFYAGGDNSELAILLCINDTMILISIKLSVKFLREVFEYDESKSGIISRVRRSQSEWNGHVRIVPCHEAA